MKFKSFKINSEVLLLLCVSAMLLPAFTLAQEFDISYDDPTGDVEDWDGFIYEYGYDYLDITYASSSENVLGTQLILEMTVTGVIVDDEDITYSFYLLDGEDWVYIVTYCNGVCNGMNMNDFSSETLPVSGSGTSTLEVRVQTSNLEDVTEFDFFGETDEYDEQLDTFFSDYVPDQGPGWDDDYYYEMPVRITEPKDGGTVSGTKTIMGYTDPDYEIESVEIQIDSQSESGWILTSTNNNWAHWNYNWQSTDVSDGTHTIYARGYDGFEYHTDSITVHVDQNNAISPRTTDMPTIDVGLQLNYEIIIPGFEGGYPFEDMDMTLETEMVIKVEKKESIEVNGTQYDTFAVDMTMSMVMSMTFEGETTSSSTTSSGTQWMRESDLATIKSDMTVESSYSYQEMTESFTQHTISTYTPPQDSYNFPISIAETWTSTSIVYTENYDDFLGSEESYFESYESPMVYEALRVEEVTVPAGTYETFVLWSKDLSEWYSSGGGLPFIASGGSGYTLNYYAPEIGFPIKTEVYQENRELVMSMELSSIGEVAQPPTANPSGHGWELPFWALLIPILLVIILVAVMANKRKKKRIAAAQESWQAYSAQTEVAGGAPQSPTAQTYTQPTSYSQPQAVQERHFYAAQIPQTQTQPSSAYVPPPPPSQARHQTQPQPSQTAQKAVVPQSTQHQITPPLPSPQSQVTYQQPKAAVIPTPTPVQPVSPLMQIRCPKCSAVFSVQKGTINVQCPKCQTKGRLD